MVDLVASVPKFTLASGDQFLPEIVSGGRFCSARSSARRDVVFDPELIQPLDEKFLPEIV